MASQLFTLPVLLAIVIGIYVANVFLKKHGVETFAAHSNDWQNDVFMLRGYVFPYVRDLFHLLRDKHAEFVLSKSSLTEEDYKVVARDPILIDARAQIKLWIDSWMRLMKQKYAAEVIRTNLENEGLTYSDGANGVLILHNVTQGLTASLIV